MCGTEDYKTRLKKYHVQCRQMSLNFYLHGVYRVYSTPLLGMTIALNLVPWILKKIFSLETDKNDVYLGGASKQNAIFQKICSKKRTHAPNVHLHRAIASSIYKVGTISKILLCDWTFKCLGSTATVLVCEYLFTLVKAKDDQSVLESGFFWHHLH